MLPLNTPSRWFLLLATAASAALPGVAQEHAGSAPKPSATPSQAVRQVGSQKVVPSLKGLVFLSKSEDLQKNGSATPGISSGAVKMLDNADFRAQMSERLGYPLTFDGLNEITHSVVAYYRQHNHPLVDAVVPSQSVQSGVIQVIVTEYKVGQVRLEGNRWFSDSIVTAPFSLHHGDTVDSAELINELDAANTNPFRRVNLVYQPSAQPGYTDVVLQTQDRLPIRVFTGFDNSGTPITGRSRWDMGATWGNALWHDEQLSYQLSTSDDFFTGRSAAPGTPGGASFVGQFLTWSMPIRGRDSISLAGNYDRSVPSVGQDFGLLGKSWGASLRYNLALRRTSSFIQTASAGYDFKSTNNNLAFGGTQVMRNNAEVDQFAAGYSASLTDKWGSTSLNTNLFFSPGNISPNNTDGDFQPAVGQSGRAMASAHYTYWRSDLNRLTKLPAHAIWSMRVLGQTSTANLLYTEQLAGGGPDIMRGYDPNALLGDEGLIVSNELRSPVFQKTGETALGGMQVVTFWDFAHLTSVHDVPNAVNHLNGSSVGMGLRYNLRANITAKADYGLQLQHLPTADSRDHLVSFALTTSY